jgi:flagellar biosynthesis protein
MEDGRQPKAAAVRYDPDKDRAPRVIAKGTGSLAAKIIEVAVQHNVPVYADPDMVEILSKVEIDREIPHGLYEAVAQVLAFVYRENERWKSRVAR